jgi:hypothetical protein
MAPIIRVDAGGGGTTGIPACPHRGKTGIPACPHRGKTGIPACPPGTGPATEERRPAENRDVLHWLETRLRVDPAPLQRWIGDRDSGWALDHSRKGARPNAGCRVAKGRRHAVSSPQAEAQARLSLYARVAELADAQDLKSCGPKGPCGFDPRPGQSPKPPSHTGLRLSPASRNTKPETRDPG